MKEIFMEQMEKQMLNDDTQMWSEFDMLEEFERRIDDTTPPKYSEVDDLIF